MAHYRPELTLNVTAKALFGAAPGDDCPDEECRGIIEEMVISWTQGEMSCVVICGNCNEEWTVAEDPEDEMTHG